ncbi:MAG: DUF2110 family protein [Candidatus Bathyarchaeia archaeon]
MPTVRLQAKIYSNSQQKLLEEKIRNLLKGLAVEIILHGTTPHGLAKLAVSGEDEKIAIKYLNKVIGICPETLENLGNGSIIKGRITKLNQSKGHIAVDIGIFLPETVEATVPLQHLQAQLVDGRKVALAKIAELFGLVENLPLTVKILKINSESGQVEAALAEKQLTLFRLWVKSLLDRLIVLGASLENVELALKHMGNLRDVVEVEPLGVFEQAVTCKLGTDAAGLVPKIGRNVPYASLGVFNPRKILDFLGDQAI